MSEPFFGFQTIYGVHGEHSTPYLTRAWIGRLRLHIFHRGDADPDPHDHPWDFWTFPLTSYVEEETFRTSFYLDLNGQGDEPYVVERNVVKAFRLHYRPATYCHRVLGRWTGQYFERHSPPLISVPTWRLGKIVTIVWRGKGSRKWGFLRNRDGNWCWTPWREYVFGGGKHAPCEPAEPQDIDSQMARLRSALTERLKEDGDG